jgi:hypothetical protein
MVISSERALAPPISRRLLTAGRDVPCAMKYLSPGAVVVGNCLRLRYPAVTRVEEGRSSNEPAPRRRGRGAPAERWDAGGSYHFASLLGRLTATAALRRFGERRVVMTAGLLAAAGLLTAVTAPAAAGAIGGLLLVGFAIAPVVPTTLSLAGRSAPGRSGQAVATTTAAGYGAFIVSPLTIGLLAQATSLRLALAVLVLTSLAIAGLAARWPAVPAIPPQLRCADDAGPGSARVQVVD